MDRNVHSHRERRFFQHPAIPSFAQLTIFLESENRFSALECNKHIS